MAVLPNLRESFNQADSSTLGPNLTWSELKGDLQTVSGAVRAVSTNTRSVARITNSTSPGRKNVRCLVKTLTQPTTSSNSVMLYNAWDGTTLVGYRISRSSANAWTACAITDDAGATADRGTPMTISSPPSGAFVMEVRHGYFNNTFEVSGLFINGVSIMGNTGVVNGGTDGAGLGIVAQDNVANVEVTDFSVISDTTVAPFYPVFCCGAECGIAAVGTTSAGVEHWSSVSGAPTVVTSGPTPMRSTRAFRFNPSAATAQLVHTFANSIGASTSAAIARFYVYFATLPSADVILMDFTGSASPGAVIFQQSDSTIRGRIGASVTTTSGIAVTTGRWYRVDFKNVPGTTQTVDIQVDGVAATQASAGGQTASTVTAFRLGQASNFTADFYIDDILICGPTNGSNDGSVDQDYPIGPGTVVGLYPNGDRTNTSANPTDGNGGHFFSATTDFGKGTSGATATGAQNAESTSWQSLDNPLTTTAGGSWIADLLGASTEHLVWTHDAMPAASAYPGFVNLALVVLATHSASATANNESLSLSDSAGNQIVLASFLDLSESTITVPVFQVLYAPGSGLNSGLFGGMLDKAKLDNMFIRWGDATDVNPDPYCDGVCIEVDYSPAQAPNKIIQVNQAVQRAAVR